MGFGYLWCQPSSPTKLLKAQASQSFLVELDIHLLASFFTTIKFHFVIVKLAGPLANESSTKLADENPFLSSTFLVGHLI